MKRFAVCILSLAEGGGEKAAINFVRAANQNGHSAVLFVIYKSGNYQVPSDVPVHYVIGKKRFVFPLFRYQRASLKLKQSIKSVEKQQNAIFDMVIANMHGCSRILKGTGLTNTWFVIHTHLRRSLQFTTKPRKHYQYKYQIYNNERLLTVCEGIKRDILEADDLSPRSVHTIYNAFDLHQVKTLANQSCDLPTEPYLIFLGRFSEEKRFDILFDAAKQINPQYKIVLLCSKADKARAMAEQYGVLERFIIPGFQHNPYPWLKQAKLLIQCSDFEGFPNVIIEAFAVNTPVVTTDSTEYENEQLTGDLAQFIVPCNDVQAFADKVNYALDFDFDIDVDSAPVLAKVSPKAVIDATVTAYLDAQCD